MNYSLEELSELAKTQKYDGFDLKKLLEDASEVLEQGLDADENIKRLQVCCILVTNSAESSVFSRLFSLAAQYKVLLHESKNIALLEYSMMSLYYRMGFIPNVVKHALAALDADSENKNMCLSIYSILTVCLKECGLYDKALEYTDAMHSLSNAVSLTDPVTLESIYEENNCSILASANRIEEMKAHLPKYLSSMQAEKELNNSEEVQESAKVNELYFRASIEGYTKDIISRYVDAAKYLFRSEASLSMIAYTPDAHIAFLKHMTEEPFLTDCIEICRSLISHETYIDAQHRILYRILLDALKKKSGEEYSALYLNYLEEYSQLLEEDAKDQNDFVKHLIQEEYRIRELNEQYASLKIKFETDLLTVCSNRSAFELNAPDFIKTNPNGSLVFIDIDNFKLTNDSYGHLAGDELLKSFVQIATGIIEKEGAKLYRYAGDEFVILSPSPASGVEKSIASLNDAYAKPLDFNGNQIKIDFSYGISEFKEFPNVLDEFSKQQLNAIVHAADMRMYECKRTRKNS